MRNGVNRSMPDNALLHRPSKGYEALVALYDATLERLTVPYESLTVDTHFGKTHVVAAGPDDTPPIIILHGAASNAVGCWPLINSLASTYRTYAPDAPRQLGKTEPFHLSPRGADYGTWLVDVLHALDVEQAFWVGFSFGGWMTLKLAALAPEYIAKAALISPVGVVRFRTQYMMQAPFLLLRILLSPTETNIRKFARLIAGPTAPDSIVDEVADAGEVFVKNFRMQDMPFRPSKRDLQRLRVPTLVLMGQHDSFCRPEAVISRLRSNLPDVQAEIIPRVGHVMFFEQPELVGGRIREFLGRTV